MKREIKSYVHVRSRTSKQDFKVLDSFKNSTFYSLEELPDISKLLPEGRINILEIGFGDGKNLFQKAAFNPEINFYGIEIYKAGIASLLKKINSDDLKNICLIFGDAKKFLAKIDAPFFDFIFILFPDPWPKKRHWKRRLIDKEFLLLLKKRLKNKGRLIVKTEWQDYAKNLANELVNFPTCNNDDSLGFLRPIKTKYERKGEEEGRTIFTYISHLNE